MAYFLLDYVNEGYDYNHPNVLEQIEISEDTIYTLKQFIFQHNSDFENISEEVTAVLNSFANRSTSDILHVVETSFIKKRRISGITGTDGLTVLYSITLFNGLNFYLTPYDINITHDGKVYNAIPVHQSNIVSAVVSENLTMSVVLGITELTDGGYNTHDVYELVNAGEFNNAELTVSYYDTLTDLEIVAYMGRASGTLQYIHGSLTITTETSLVDVLYDTFPKILYSPKCQHKVYGIACGANKNTFTSVVFVGAGSTNDTIYSTDIDSTQAEKYMNGIVEVVSGDNQGHTYRVVIVSDFMVTITPPAPYPFSVGDSIRIIRPCDKTSGTCTDVFNNFSNFFGFEGIPSENILTTYYR